MLSPSFQTYENHGQGGAGNTKKRGKKSRFQTNPKMIFILNHTQRWMGEIRKIFEFDNTNQMDPNGVVLPFPYKVGPSNRVCWFITPWNYDEYYN